MNKTKYSHKVFTKTGESFELNQNEEIIDIQSTPAGVSLVLRQSKEHTVINPGIFKLIVEDYVYKLRPLVFTKDKTLSGINTFNYEIKEIVDKFFNNIEKYKQFGIDVPKKNLLLYGPPGTGKTTSIIEVCEGYRDNKTGIVLLPSNLNISSCEEYIRNCTYNNIDKLIIILEDINGNSDEDRSYSNTQALLSFLDNTQNTFRIPTVIIATTNYIENLQKVLSNRPGRFDKKIKVDYPNEEQKINLLQFFIKENLEENVKKLLTFKKLSVAHLKEIALRFVVENIPLIKATEAVIEEIKLFETGFNSKNKLGLKNE